MLRHHRAQPTSWTLHKGRKVCSSWPPGRPHARDPNLHEEGLPEWLQGGHVASTTRARGPGTGALWLAASRVHFPLGGPHTMRMDLRIVGLLRVFPVGGDDAHAAFAACVDGLAVWAFSTFSPTTSSHKLATEAI